MKKTILALITTLLIGSLTIASQPNGYYVLSKMTKEVITELSDGYTQDVSTVVVNYNQYPVPTETTRVVNRIIYDSDYTESYGINTLTIEIDWIPIIKNGVLQGFQIKRTTVETGVKAHPVCVEVNLSIPIPSLIPIVGQTFISYPPLYEGDVSEKITYRYSLDFSKNDKVAMDTTFYGWVANPQTEEPLNYVGPFYNLHHPTTGPSVDSFQCFNVNNLYYIDNVVRFKTTQQQ